MDPQLMLQGRSAINASRPTCAAAYAMPACRSPPALDGGSEARLDGIWWCQRCRRAGRLHPQCQQRPKKILATASQGSDTTGGTTARVMGWEGR